jgi:hypothetical protein
VDVDEINQLQSDLDTLERLFQTLLGQSVAAQLAENIHGHMIDEDMMLMNEQGCPPASESAIKNLTCIAVSEKDLADECNRECCICFFQHKVGDTGVARLPCGHIFHKPCISEWLSKKCTCPLCRYEIRTDNEMYEIERIERMRARKIRVRSHEIGRMSTTDLQHLTATSEMDHDTLLEMLKNSANIEILESEPSTSPLSSSVEQPEEEHSVSDDDDLSTEDHDVEEEDDVGGDGGDGGDDSKMPAALEEYLIGVESGSGSGSGSDEEEKEDIQFTTRTMNQVRAQSIASGMVAPND